MQWLWHSLPICVSFITTSPLRMIAAYQQLFEVDAAYQNIFTEGTDSGITAARIEFIHLFRTQQTHLTMPFAGVSITLDAEIFLRTISFTGCFSVPFFSLIHTALIMPLMLASIQNHHSFRLLCSADAHL